MFADQMSAAITEARTLTRLDDLSRAIWQGLNASAVTDEQAQSLAELLHARRSIVRGDIKPVGIPPGRRSIFPPRRPQRPPLRPVAIARRRHLAASGGLPPSLACKFTVGELAALRIVSDEIRQGGRCDRSLAEIAARAGIRRTTAQNAMRVAAALGLITIQERRRQGQKNLPNVVRIVSREWLQWLKRGGQRSKPIGFKKADPTDKEVREKGRSGIPPSASDRQHGHESHSEHPKKGIRLSRGGFGEGSAR